jgi:hypothetical protein
MQSRYKNDQKEIKNKMNKAMAAKKKGAHFMHHFGAPPKFATYTPGFFLASFPRCLAFYHSEFILPKKFAYL